MAAPRLKRKTPDEMFESVAAFERAHSTSPNMRDGVARFFVVSHFHACIRAAPEAVDFYFDTLHPRRSWRTEGVRLVFKAATRSGIARAGLSRAGLLDSVYDAAPLEGVSWSEFDVLLAEWQFTGAFSASKGTVSHVLTQERYAENLRNEVEARRQLGDVVRIPHLHGSWTSGEARGWTEETIFQSPPADSRPFDEGQRMMLRAYEVTRETVNLDDYLDRLAALCHTRYADSPSVVKAPVDDLLALARVSAAKAKLHSIPLARCHGDLNWAQMVGPPEAPLLIDWSESEVCSIFHDLVYSSIRYGRWRGYTDKKYPDMMTVLRDGLQDDMVAVPGIFASALVLAEVGIKQHVDHVCERGSFSAWRAHVGEAFEAVGWEGNSE